MELNLNLDQGLGLNMDAGVDVAAAEFPAIALPGAAPRRDRRVPVPRAGRHDGSAGAGEPIEAVRGADVMAQGASVHVRLPVVTGAPRLTAARCELLREIDVVDAAGERRRIAIPAERPLTVFVDRRELVTLMTLGAMPEWLVLGYLCNQRLIDEVTEIESVTVDWDVGAAAVRTRGGLAQFEQRTASRVVTTGCGQGTVFGDLMAQATALTLPDAAHARITQDTLLAVLEAMRVRDSIHKRAGSVHGCALFQGEQMLMAVEDVGRHNAVDTISGWMALHAVAGDDKVLYTTGRLTSEMVLKAARIGVPIIVSRNGVTAMGHEMAQRLGMTLFGRAANRQFLCYCGAERFDAAPRARS
jgi:FdhD protein